MPSDDLHLDTNGVSSECFNVGSVSSENGAARFSECYDDGVNRRAGARQAMKLGSASRNSLADSRVDDARLEASASAAGAAILDRVANRQE